MNYTEHLRKKHERSLFYENIERQIQAATPILGVLPVLIACECSQVETLTFRAHGIEAYSCDIQRCAGTHPEWHIQCDVLELLEPNRWGLIIAHPPCTYLTAAGGNLINEPGRAAQRNCASQFFMKFFNFRDCPTAIENPRPLRCAGLPPYNQVVSPHLFGSIYQKRTCLWLYDLPPLLPTHAPTLNPKKWHASTRGSYLRSLGFPELAESYAQQWTQYIKHIIP